jgi:hypothetical protein
LLGSIHQVAVQGTGVQRLDFLAFRCRGQLLPIDTLRQQIRARIN